MITVVYPEFNEKEKKVIELLEKNYTYSQIIKELHVSPTFIAMVKKEVTGEDRPLSLTSKAFKIFLEGKQPVEVAISLNLTTDEVLKIHNDFLKLPNHGEVATILFENKENLKFLDVFQHIRKKILQYRILKVN